LMSEAVQNAVETRTRPNRLTLRVLLRVAAAVFLVAGMIGGWYAMARHRAQRRANAIDVVLQQGGRVYMDYQWGAAGPVADGRPLQPAWLRRLLGGQMFDRAVAVDLRETRDVDAAIAQLPLMPYLRHIDARGASVSDASLRVLKPMTRLKYVDLSKTSVSDEGVAQLAGAAELEHLSLADTRVSDASRAVLAGLKNLRHLDLSGTELSATAIERLTADLPRCTVIGR